MPVAPTVNTTVTPVFVLTETGWLVIIGAGNTVKNAGLLVTAPPEFETTK